MARFTNIVPNRLWQVNDLLPAEQVEEILSTDWLSIPWNHGTVQPTWARRYIALDDPISMKFESYIVAQLDKINEAITKNFQWCSTVFWLDEPGFHVNIHTDGELPNVMQMYWIMPGPDFGTGFYRHKNGQDLIHQFVSQPNTGYIMLNRRNPDGSQPLQWHGMVNPVPPGTIRLSSYSYLK